MIVTVFLTEGRWFKWCLVMVYIWCKRYTETQVMLYDALWRVRDEGIPLPLLELLGNMNYDMLSTSKCLLVSAIKPHRPIDCCVASINQLL
jgi:hypothetical protein